MDASAGGGTDEHAGCPSDRSGRVPAAARGQERAPSRDHGGGARALGPCLDVGAFPDCERARARGGAMLALPMKSVRENTPPSEPQRRDRARADRPESKAPAERK